MDDGQRAPDDVLARLGLTGGGTASTSGRAARRRATEPDDPPFPPGPNGTPGPDRNGRPRSADGEDPSSSGRRSREADAEGERTTWLEVSGRGWAAPGADRTGRPDGDGRSRTREGGRHGLVPPEPPATGRDGNGSSGTDGGRPLRATGNNADGYPAGAPTAGPRDDRARDDRNGSVGRNGFADPRDRNGFAGSVGGGPGSDGHGRTGPDRPNGTGGRDVAARAAGPWTAAPRAAGPGPAGPRGGEPPGIGAREAGPRGAAPSADVVRGTGPHTPSGNGTADATTAAPLRSRPRAGGGPGDLARTARRPAPTDHGTADATTALPHRARSRPPAEDATAEATTVAPLRSPARRPAADGAADPTRTGPRRPTAANGTPDASPRSHPPADADAADATAVPRRPRPPAEDATTALPRATPTAGRRSRHSAGPADAPTTAVPRAVRDRRPADPPTTALPADRARPAADAPVREKPDERARHIDETLTRLTAAHAGIDLGDRDDDPEPEPEEPRRRRRSPFRALVVAAVAALVLVAGTGWGAQRWLASGVREVAALDPGSGAIVDAAAQEGAQNVLVVTADTRSKEARPDTVVVAHVVPGGGVTVLAIPADLEINRPPCARWDAASGSYTSETVPAEARTQLAGALELGGPRCATRVVQQLTGLAVTQYVGLDLDALGTAVDAVSGVTVCVPRPVVDGTLGPIAPDAGPTTLDGRKARDYVTAADVVGDTAAADGRVGRQQQVLAALLDTALSGTGLLDLPRVRVLRAALGPALTTDGAGLDQVLALARSIGPGSTAVTRTVPSTADPQGKGTVLADGDAAALFDALRTGKPLPPATTASTGPDPASVKVDVLNATERTGQAAQTGDVLKGLGFTVGTVGSADRTTSQTVIRFSPDQQAAADVLAASVPSATTVADPGANGVLQLVLGRSFDSVVKAPSAAPAAPPTAAVADACS